MPYVYIGMLTKNHGKPAAFLSRGETLLVVSAGDLLDNGTYRVDALETNEIVLTYMPLKQRQTLNVSWEHP